MRIVLVFLVVFFGIVNGADIDTKIKQTSQRLSSFSKDYKRLNAQMAQTAEAIIRQKKEILLQQKQIAQLEKELQAKANSYETSKKQLAQLLQQQKKLIQQQQTLEDDLTFIIAQSVSLSVLLDEQYSKSIDSILELEVLKAKLKQYKNQIKKLNKNYYKIASTITLLDAQAKKLKQSIELIDKKKKRLVTMQKKNQQALKQLKLAKASYKEELKKLLKKQDELKRTLSRLKIIKIDKERRAAEERARRAAFARGNKNLPKVKQYGQSYQDIKTEKYTGPKTIAPLRRYTIVKKYGTYTDPIYGIKVFNESITMKSKVKNAKVRNVFNGKVIYAEKTALLDYVVIVEHRNGLHTIYANLYTLAPGIKKGKRVKKGHLLGRVRHELIFEVTQKSSHINPIRLFK